MMKIAIIGCGSIGLAYARSFLQFNLVSRDHLLLVARNKAHQEKLKQLDLGLTAPGIDEQLADYGVIILSIKPQDFNAAVSPLKTALRPYHVLLSVMAGITIQSITEQIGHESVIRAMPNTPAQLGMGMTALSASNTVNVHQMRIIENLLSTTGRTIFLEDEKLLDAVTALSGTGPAYFFLIVKAMVEAGVQMGLEESVSALLVKQTMLGSFHLMNQSPQTLDELIAAVASKGGTTEAAFRKLKAGQFDRLLIDAIQTARDRAEELSQLFDHS